MDNQVINTLLTQDAELIGSFAMVLVTLVLAYQFPLSPAWTPTYYWQRLARSLADKTCRPTNSRFQQNLAGTLAALLLIVPFWLIMVLLPTLAYYPWFFEGIILYISLIGVQVNRVATAIQTQLLVGNKALAKLQLHSLVNVDTQALSVIGISKLTIESQLTTPARTLLTCLCYFPIGGVALVLLARMVNELAFCWPIQHPRYHAFAQSITRLNRVLQWLPELVWQWVMAILNHQSLPLKALASTRGESQLPTSLTIGARSLTTRLGGPVMFDGHKVSRTKIDYGTEPYAATIAQAASLVRRSQLFIICLCSSLPLVWISLRVIASS
ncbi:cobalamin biosynthesis protein [Shewanella sp. NIFS-20-20]|uniref:cobalamin biosynthesis protein n=1 Tax=Shewanella sp. NIFS-20-20 TaxID=2853806 RepID=UPI001C4527F7|nr:cobalamin biosynthesis protein [Shewanella sp. NIFS-20-20]MBV7314255.1 cobalamin biosynthesis protein [Shewanella sp. NIFS-20-20]